MATTIAPRFLSELLTSGGCGSGSSAQRTTTFRRSKGERACCSSSTRRKRSSTSVPMTRSIVWSSNGRVGSSRATPLTKRSGIVRRANAAPEALLRSTAFWRPSSVAND